MCFEMNIYRIENTKYSKGNNERKKWKIQIIRHQPTNKRKNTVHARINLLRDVKCRYSRQAIYNGTQPVSDTIKQFINH